MVDAQRRARRADEKMEGGIIGRQNQLARWRRQTNELPAAAETVAVCGFRQGRLGNPRRFQKGIRSNRLSTRSTAPRSASKNCRVVRKTLVAFYSKSFSRHSSLVDVACAKISAKVIKIILRTVVISFVFIFRSLYNDFVCGSR